MFKVVDIILLSEYLFSGVPVEVLDTNNFSDTSFFSVFQEVMDYQKNEGCYKGVELYCEGYMSPRINEFNYFWIFLYIYPWIMILIPFVLIAVLWRVE